MATNSTVGSTSSELIVMLCMDSSCAQQPGIEFGPGSGDWLWICDSAVNGCLDDHRSTRLPGVRGGPGRAHGSGVTEVEGPEVILCTACVQHGPWLQHGHIVLYHTSHMAQMCHRWRGCVLACAVVDAEDSGPGAGGCV